MNYPLSFLLLLQSSSLSASALFPLTLHSAGHKLTTGLVLFERRWRAWFGLPRPKTSGQVFLLLFVFCCFPHFFFPYSLNSSSPLNLFVDLDFLCLRGTKFTFVGKRVWNTLILKKTLKSQNILPECASSCLQKSIHDTNNKWTCFFYDFKCLLLAKEERVFFHDFN